MNIKNITRHFSSYWFRSAFYTFLQRFSLILFGLVNFMILIRYLTILQMGTWALFLTIVTLLETNKSALLKNAHIRFVSISNGKEERSEIASSSLVINVLMSTLFILLLLFLGRFLVDLLNAENDLMTMLISFIPGIFAMVLFSHFETVQQSHLDFKGIFVGNLIKQVVFFLILVTHLIFDKPLDLILLSIYQSISISIGAIVLYLYSRKYLLNRFKPSKHWIKNLLAYGRYIFGSGVLSSIYINLDQLMTAAFLTPASVAYYNAARRINGFIDVPTYAAAEIAFPKMSQASSNEGITKIKYLYEKIVALLLSLIIPIGLVVVLFPKLFILIIAGEKYLAAAPILQIYIVVSLIGTLQHQAGTTLYSIGKTRLCFFGNCFSLLVNFGSTFFCLKFFGFYGAAFGALISSIVTSVFWYSIMRREVGFEISNIPTYSRQYYQLAFTKVTGFLKARKSVG